jgi:polygalacturonase
VFAENCHFDSPNLEMAMRFKTNPARGGFIKNVYIRGCEVKLAKVGIHMTLRYSSSGAMNGETIPVMSNIDIRNSTFKELTKQPVFIEGWSPSNPITNVSIVDCKFLHATEKSFVTNATDIVMQGSSGY